MAEPDHFAPGGPVNMGLQDLAYELWELWLAKGRRPGRPPAIFKIAGIETTDNGPHDLLVKLEKMSAAVIEDIKAGVSGQPPSKRKKEVEREQAREDKASGAGAASDSQADGPVTTATANGSPTPEAEAPASPKPKPTSQVPSPVNKNQAPTSRDQGPSSRDQAATGMDQAPAGKDQAPAAKQQAPAPKGPTSREGSFSGATTGAGITAPSASKPQVVTAIKPAGTPGAPGSQGPSPAPRTQAQTMKTMTATANQHANIPKSQPPAAKDQQTATANAQGPTTAKATAPPPAKDGANLTSQLSSQLSSGKGQGQQKDAPTATQPAQAARPNAPTPNAPGSLPRAPSGQPPSGRTQPGSAGTPQANGVAAPSAGAKRPREAGQQEQLKLAEQHIQVVIHGASESKGRVRMVYEALVKYMRTHDRSSRDRIMFYLEGAGLSGLSQQLDDSPSSCTNCLMALEIRLADALGVPSAFTPAVVEQAHMHSRASK